jgi:hypothetical protein
MFWTKSKNLWQLIFILCILYAISSMNVLILVKSILPYLQGAFLKTHILVYFSQISFALAVFLSVYHFVNMYGKTKKQTGQKTDWIGRISKALFVLIIVYAAISVYTLLWGGIGVAPALPGTDIDAMWIYYAIFSFAVVIGISVFHLGINFLVEKEA